MLEQKIASYRLQPMGMGYVDRSGKANIMQSNRPAAHLRESRSFDNLLRSYMTSAEGKRFLQYAHSQGKNFINIVGAGSADLGDHVVAALLHDGEKGVIVGNYEGQSFQGRVQELGAMYGLSEQAALEYVLNHELGHAAGNNSETSNEGFVKQYFLQQAQRTTGPEQRKYVRLAAVAAYREKEAKKAGKS